MSTGKGMRAHFETLNYDEIRQILFQIFDKYNCLNHLDDFIVNKAFFVLKEKFNQVFMIKDDDKEVLNFINDLSNLGFFPYSVGVPIIIYRDKSKVSPTIAFGKYLVNICSNKIIINDERILYKITYGRSVIIDKRFSYKYAIISDNLGNFIAYSKIVRLSNGKSEVIPTKDIGWYLRKGG